MRMIRNRNNDNELGGYVLTPQRQLILDTLRRSAQPVDAKELYWIVRQKDETVSLATVYRSLSLFKKIGLIDEHRFGKSCWCYEAKQSQERQHIFCKCCGKIVVFESPLITAMIKDIQDKNGFAIERVEVCVRGTCRECRQNNNASE
jgi:Fe2+ or Zn2+ uptake regulation protein